jgi:hypothetical protein
MSSRSSYTKSQKKRRGENNELVPVRSNIFYGIEIKEVNEQKTNIKRELVITPNITFYDNYTKIFLDFSDIQNNKDKSDIKSFFDLIIPGASFEVKNSTWKNDTIDKKTFNLSGIYKFSKIVDKIVFCEVMSVNSYSNNFLRYDKEFFLELPVIEFSSIISPTKKEVKSIIINHLGKNSKSSFYYLGIKTGDYIQIQNEKEKYKIESVAIDNEGKENITVIGNPIPQNKVGSPILITLHQQNNDKIKLDYDNVILGKCELSQDNAIFACIDNHTELQTKLREDTVKNIKATFYPNKFCLINNFTLDNSTVIVNNTTPAFKSSSTSPQFSVTSRINLLNNLFNAQ